MADDKTEFLDPVEDCPWRTPREILAHHGYTPLPPSELDDRQLPGRLWELIYAAAARRFFFDSTNHLSDRALYTLLWEQWLDKPTPDIPLTAETNTNLTLCEFEVGGLTGEEIWRRYYADEDTRQHLRATEPNLVLPVHEDPPYDRDRFLPVPPIPLEAHAGWLPGDDVPTDEEDSDPLPITDGQPDNAEDDTDSDFEALFGTPDSDSPNPALEAQLRAMEPENWTPPAQKLQEENIPLLPPAEITDETLGPILWELLHNLALCGFYILRTNHLSDRELYGELWHHGLREPAHLPGRNPRGGFFHDFLGSWGEEEMETWLRYYATDEERAKHASEWPKDPLPPKETAPYNRDWRLPKGPF